MVSKLLQVADLPQPVVASKSNWLPATNWLGFTPGGTGRSAANQCQSTISRQCHGGYVIEYVTETFDKPNKGYENHPKYLADRAFHREIAGCLVAIHRLRPSARPLADIIGSAEFELLQDIWAEESNRIRWSVAFPIVESYRILSRPKAKDVFGSDDYLYLYGYQSGQLRPLEDRHRSKLAHLTIERIEAGNARIGIEDEFLLADRSDIDERYINAINSDLKNSALEGQDAQRWIRIRRRAAWLAQRFAWERARAKRLHCDDCSFQPTSRPDLDGVSARSCLDVHHKDPIAEGVRYTTLDDFALLCPTCHRIAHLKIKRDRGKVGEIG